MQCNKCKSTLIYNENDKMWQCPKCRTFVRPMNEKYESFLKDDLKKKAALSGFIPAFILLAGMYYVTEGDIFFWPLFSAVFIIWGVAFPCLGATLILMEKFTIGGIILAIGSLLLIPMGLLGIYYGNQSIQLGKQIKQDRAFKSRQ